MPHDLRIPLARLSDATIARLNEVLPATWSHANPIDIVGDSDSARYANTLAACMADEQLSIQTEIAQSAHSIGLGERAWGTVALGGDACTTETQVAELLERAEVWGLGGYYLVCQPPKSEYLSNNPMWVANVLDVIAGLRMLGAKVILGYANHQMLIAALSKADAICSGTYQNVRVFTPERFRQKETETIRRRSTWYYCPHAMSEYQDSFLDIAFNLGVLADMKPDVEMAGYGNRLFSGLQPTTVGFDESASFRHYLNSLRQQCRSSVKPTFESTKQGILD